MILAAHHFPVLVTGAQGLLGRALGPLLAQSAPAPQALRLTDLADLDVTDPQAVSRAVRDLKARTIFHLAAWTDVDGAEAHPAEARRLNVDAAENVARAAAEAGALVVHISTDFVFDGAKIGAYVEDDPPSPRAFTPRRRPRANRGSAWPRRSRTW
jgi:dTDP-4-dehydrorhamnose reductase